jgi:FkbM family methyltransferase
MERTPLRAIGGLAVLGDPNYGGWMLPADLIEPGWVCYSIGAGGDIRFDLDLIERYGVTVRAIEPVAKYVQLAIKDAGGDPRFSIEQVALAASDGPVRMQVTHDPDSESVSPAGLYDSSTFIEVPGRTLASLMAERGDTKVELLKIDVEGGEYDLLPTLDLQALGVKVFAVQLHHTGSVGRAKELVSELASRGYDPVARQPAVKIAFARRDLI